MTPSEARELAAVVLERLAPRLPELAASGGTRRRDTPIHQLYALVAERLRAMDEQDALTELARDPRNDSLVRRLLASAAADDAAYATALAAAVAALPAGAAPAPRSAGRSASDGETSAPGAAEGSAPDRDGNGPDRPARERRPRRLGVWIALAALGVLAAVGFLVVRSVVDNLTNAGGLNARSTCTEYRQAPPEERVAAIRQIGLAKGVSGVDSPLVMTAIDQLCETQPEAAIGDLIGRLG
ncbi:hypothetical protein [Plantactinospora sonchi]|uniref:Uncharacterized protein n=1 Tax=Plantactinospora sonchi TaxID=1544735 RepID=A0ABU7RLL8_9ACTN